MNKMQTISSALGVVLAAALVAGCGGGSHGSSSVPAVATIGTGSGAGASAARTAAVTVTVKIPPASQSASARRNPAYVSPNSYSITASANPGGASATATCESGTCAVTLYAGVNTTSISVSLLSSDDDVLSQATQNVSLTAGQPNTVNMTFDGVVATLTATTSVSQFVIGVSTPVTVTITPYDASGAQIMPPGSLIDTDGNVIASSSVQSVSLTHTGADASYLTLGAPTWSSSTDLLTATGTYNDSGAGTQSPIAIAFSSSATSSVTLTPASVAVNPKALSIIESPLQQLGFQLAVGTLSPNTDTTVEVQSYPSPNPFPLSFALVSNFNDAGALLALEADSCSTLASNNPGLQAAFPSPNPTPQATMPATLSYPFTVNIAGPNPGPTPGNTNCSFTVTETTNNLSATTTINLTNATLYVQGKRK